MGELILYRVFCFLFGFLLLLVDSSPVGENPGSLHVLPYIAKRSDGSSVCEEKEVTKWYYDFHECFIDRKYKDGGRDLDNIVDRILEHGEACIETSSRECRPDFQGFTALMNKTITQMKNYAEIYLEEIYKGRENIKDLQCVETTLSIKTYKNCFRDIVSEDNNVSEETYQKAVKNGILCANRKNTGCSTEAKTAFNRIVRIILGVEQPVEEEFEEVKPTEAPEAPMVWVEEKFEEVKPTEAPKAPMTWVEEEFEKVKPTEAPEAPMMWYDYLAYPFVMAWRAIVSWFS